MKVFLVILLLAGVLASGCTVPDAPTNATNSTVNQTYEPVVYGTVPENFTWENYTSPKGGFSLEYPSYMEVANGSSDIVFFLTPRENELDFRENVNVKVTSYDKSFSVGLDSYGRSLEKFINANYYTPKIEQSYNTILNNESVRLVVFTGRQKSDLLALKFRETIWIKGQTVYELTYSAADEEYGRFANVTNRMADSFRIL